MSVNAAPMHQDAESLRRWRIRQQKQRKSGDHDEHRREDGLPHVGERLFPGSPHIACRLARLTNAMAEMDHLVDPHLGVALFAFVDRNSSAWLFSRFTWPSSLHQREAAQMLRRVRVAGHAAPTLPAILRTVRAALIRSPQLVAFGAGAEQRRDCARWLRPAVAHAFPAFVTDPTIQPAI
jgi:hypothetical protein